MLTRQILREGPGGEPGVPHVVLPAALAVCLDLFLDLLGDGRHESDGISVHLGRQV